MSSSCSALDKSRTLLSNRLIDAMRCLDESGTELVLAVDGQGRLVGTLSDGDIRRAILRGATLETPISGLVHREFTAVSPAAGRSEVLDLMQARSISAVPILDAEGMLVGLHLIREVLGGIQRASWAVIMAGGQGTRLRPLTEHIPKPMIRVAGRPILERLVLHLVGSGIRQIFLSVNYLAHFIEQHFGDGSRFGCRITYLREDRPLGTAGSLRLLPELPRDPLLVLNGDLVTQADIGALLDAHRTGGQRLTVGVLRYFHTIPFGCVELDGPRVVHLEEKPQISRLVNAGIYAIDSEVIGLIPPGVAYPMTDLIDQLLASGQLVHAFEIDDDWVDVGRQDQLRRAQGKEG